VRLPIRDAPPPLTVNVSYRQLYEHEAFAQRELVDSGRLNGDATHRGFEFAIGEESREGLDRRGAFSPVAFAGGGYTDGFFGDTADDLEALAFREETEYVPWSNYTWEAWGHPQVSPLYSQWQLLYLDAAFRETAAELPLELVAGPTDELAERIEAARWAIEGHQQLLAEMDAVWRPLMKVLVAVQNRYWPKVTGRSVVGGTPATGFVDAGGAPPDAGALQHRLGCSMDEITATYEFLVGRGLDREPQDKLTGLRRFVPREYHVRWAGRARHAQDHFDAAQMLYLWLRDLTGEPPGHPKTWPMDGRQDERRQLYELGAGAAATSDEVKEHLIATELYPAGPLVVGEGESERIIIDALVYIMGGGTSAFGFHDLNGDGAAARVRGFSQLFSRYASATFVVVDNEGNMAEELAKIPEATLPKENVLLASSSLEGDNFDAQELIDAARALAANPPEGRAAVVLTLTAEELRACHADRSSRVAGNPPGIAETLISMARNPEHGAANMLKTELAEELARRVALEVHAVDGPDAFEAICKKRPIVRFVRYQMMPVILRPRPMS
jgi:hypothetical protein